MKELAIQFRAAQFISHGFHNFVRGQSFFEDHEYFGGLYGAYESAYDALIERMIGNNEVVDLMAINQAAMEYATNAKYIPTSKNADAMFSLILELERAIQDVGENLCESDISCGTENFIQGLCDESEQRVYKIQQRLARY
jgi:DNA-binding ferritin-like protein